MSGDKRSVSTDALETLGSIIDEHAGRDAIHVAVEPVEAGQILAPGIPVLLKDGKAYRAFGDEGIGVVDPFIKNYVGEGQRFWLLLNPRTITSLRHVWSHPAFEDAETVAPVSGDKAASERWLRDYCEREVDFATYEEIIQVALGEDVSRSDDGYYGLRNEGDYIISMGRDAGGEIPFEFWYHLEILTGQKITNRPSYFSCSC